MWYYEKNRWYNFMIQDAHFLVPFNRFASPDMWKVVFYPLSRLPHSRTKSSLYSWIVSSRRFKVSRKMITFYLNRILIVKIRHSHHINASETILKQHSWQVPLKSWEKITSFQWTCTLMDTQWYHLKKVK